MSNYYENVQASLLAFCGTIVDDVIGIAPTIQVIKFDAYAEPGLMPETDLIGPFKMEMTDEEGLITVMCTILISTQEDVNLFRLDKIVGETYSKLRPRKTIPLLDSDTGSALGILNVVPGVTVMPLDQSTNRPFKGIAIAFKSSEVPT